MKGKKQLSTSSEDYLEAIYLICQEHGQARSKDIMERLGVKGPSVTEALQLLSEKGMVNYEPYSAITLTELGESVARDILFRHETLRDFFIEVLGVDEQTADDGACKMEHAASPEIIDRIVLYVRYLREECEGKSCEETCSFADYLEKGQQKDARGQK